MPSEYKPPEYKPPKMCLKMSMSPGLIIEILRYLDNRNFNMLRPLTYFVGGYSEGVKCGCMHLNERGVYVLRHILLKLLIFDVKMLTRASHACKNRSSLLEKLVNENRNVKDIKDIKDVKPSY